MKIGVVYNDKKEDCKDYVLKLRAYCESHDIAVNVATCEFTDPHMFVGSDFILAVGGDGTFLKATKATFDSGIPILGFNLGTFGLLAEYNEDDMQEVISRLMMKDYFTEERRMLNFNMYDESTGAYWSRSRA